MDCKSKTYQDVIVSKFFLGQSAVKGVKTGFLVERLCRSVKYE